MFNFMRLPPLRRLMLMKTIAGGGSWDTITGNPVTFSAKAAPLRQLEVAFSPKQAGSGDPSPDNVRPISGWSSLTVYHSGADTSNPQTISINLGSTVYSGTLDVLTGVVTVTHKGVDMGDLSWTYVAGDTVFYSAIADKYNSTNELRCSCYKTGGNTGYSTPDYTIGYSSNASLVKRVFVGDPRYTTAADFKTGVTGQTLVYRLAEPLNIQLTPQEVSSLLGENNMWSDANGDLTVEYRSN